jgi:hypothetical protein
LGHTGCLLAKEKQQVEIFPHLTCCNAPHLVNGRVDTVRGSCYGVSLSILPGSDIDYACQRGEVALALGVDGHGECGSAEAADGRRRPEHGAGDPAASLRRLGGHMKAASRKFKNRSELITGTRSQRAVWL